MDKFLYCIICRIDQSTPICAWKRLYKTKSINYSYLKNFQYFAPHSIEEACMLLEKNVGESRPLAGGQSLIPLMKLGLADVKSIVDLKKIPNLDYVRKEDNQLAIGALTTHSELVDSDVLSMFLPLLADTARAIGHPQIRNRGTIGGSISHCDPSADYPPTLVTLDAKMVTRKTKGRERLIRADDFFKGVFETSLEEGELLTEIRVPIPPQGSRYSYQKLVMPNGGFAMVLVSVMLIMERNVCKNAKITVGGVTEHPFRATMSEETLVDKNLDYMSVISASSNHVLDDVEVMSGIEYPHQLVEKMVRVYTRRALTSAIEIGNRSSSV